MKNKPQSPAEKKKHLKFLFDFISANKLAVIATLSESGSPEAAVVGIAVIKKLEIICSSFTTSVLMD